MLRLLTRVATGIHMAVFAVFCLVASPVVLFHFGVSAVRDWIESRWPDSERARAVSFWLGLLAPIVLLAVLAVALGFAIARVRALKLAELGAVADPTPKP
jgi:hypothetical protein